MNNLWLLVRSSVQLDVLSSKELEYLRNTKVKPILDCMVNPEAEVYDMVLQPGVLQEVLLTQITE